MALEIAVLAISTSAGLFVPSAAEEYDASEFQQTADMFCTSQILLSSFRWKFSMFVKTQGKSTSEGFCYQVIFTTVKYNTIDECPWLRISSCKNGVHVPCRLVSTNLGTVCYLGMKKKNNTSIPLVQERH